MLRVVRIQTEPFDQFEIRFLNKIGSVFHYEFAFRWNVMGMPAWKTVIPVYLDTSSLPQGSIWVRIDLKGIPGFIVDSLNQSLDKYPPRALPEAIEFRLLNALENVFSASSRGGVTQKILQDLLSIQSLSDARDSITRPEPIVESRFLFFITLLIWLGLAPCAIFFWKRLRKSI
ncbi:MAG: hypothetical protein HY537_15380 [Deltaproteobacteria bacterium]|nr:hypothetical protein [Deltaproteobacteria bacterium]